MTPKEKAKELVDKMYALNKDDFVSEYISKATALIAVDEILNIESFHLLNSTLKNDIDYWREVKKEMKLLR